MNAYIIPAIKKYVKPKNVHQLMHMLQPQDRVLVIHNAVEQVTGVSLAQMRTQTRKTTVCRARQIEMYFLCMYTKMSLYSIGHRFQRKVKDEDKSFDHTTVIHARETIRSAITSPDPRWEYVRDMCTKITDALAQINAKDVTEDVTEDEYGQMTVGTFQTSQTPS